MQIIYHIFPQVYPLQLFTLWKWINSIYIKCPDGLCFQYSIAWEVKCILFNVRSSCHKMFLSLRLGVGFGLVTCNVWECNITRRPHQLLSMLIPLYHPLNPSNVFLEEEETLQKQFKSTKTSLSWLYLSNKPQNRKQHQRPLAAVPALWALWLVRCWVCAEGTVGCKGNAAMQRCRWGLWERQEKC